MKTPLQTILTDLISSFIKSKRLRVELLQDSDLGTFDYRTSIPKLADKCLNLVCIDMGPIGNITFIDANSEAMEYKTGLVQESGTLANKSYLDILKGSGVIAGYATIYYENFSRKISIIRWITKMSYEIINSGTKSSAKLRFVSADFYEIDQKTRKSFISKQGFINCAY
jgi:hypothetical protein